MIREAVLWIAASVVVYAYAGYPLLLRLLRPFARRPVRKAPIEPTVSLLVAAYDEADVIAEKIANALALDYPAGRLEIVVASDGSSDGTGDRVRAAAVGARSRVRLVEFSEHRGKVQALNGAIRTLSGEIVVFSDASSLLEPRSLRELVANFADPRVGAASGVYRVRNRDGSNLGRQEDFYWRYETFLKLQEARFGTMTGAHGSLYAMRRELYPFPPPDTINDDFVIPTSVVARGYRIAYEPQAVAYEEAHEMEGFGRRVRVTAGNVAQLRQARTLVRRPFVLFCFLSHKATRLAAAPALVAALGANLLLVAAPAYAALFAAQAGFYALALLGALRRLGWKPLRLPYYFCMINAAVFVWAWRRLAARRRRTPTDGGRPDVVWT